VPEAEPDVPSATASLLLHSPVGVNAGHVEHTRFYVNVAPFEREHSSGRSPTKIEKSPPAAKNPNQPSPRINENPPAETVAQALENGQKQVDRAK
jgi:hypothetical protein